LGHRLKDGELNLLEDAVLVVGGLADLCTHWPSPAVTTNTGADR
jgi:hypothetical protein